MVNLRGDEIVNEWMLFSFCAKEAEGQALVDTEEGRLEWHPLADIPSLPMAEGDRQILDHLIHGTDVLMGTFRYTEDFELIDYKLERNGE